jgi:hypothetical protein
MSWPDFLCGVIVALCLVRIVDVLQARDAR